MTGLITNLSSDQRELIANLIEEAVKPLRKQIEELEREVNCCADQNHYHDEYASADHVERSEGSFNSQLYQVKNDISNLEYRISDVQRTAERAQSTADSASRSARGGYY